VLDNKGAPKGVDFRDFAVHGRLSSAVVREEIVIVVVVVVVVVVVDNGEGLG
jgi:hypothetical protein